jgi:hypothetical protein
MFPGSRTLWLLALGTGASACHEPPEPPRETLCEPATQIYCRCPSGRGGLRRCRDDGRGFEECAPCSTTSGGAAASGGGGGATETSAPLFEACASDGDCQSGLCRTGTCTQPCETLGDCELGVAECVAFAGETVCRPICRERADCEERCGGEICGACGYVYATDALGIRACGDWGARPRPAPVGAGCLDDRDCDLGWGGAERVCEAGACARGCRDDGDCPAGNTCAATRGLGACE